MELTSIIMPCHNNLAYTSLAVESLFRHTKLPFELILVDEASTDGSKGYFDELRRSKTNVKVVTKGQEGFTSAVNRGLEIARGDLLCVVNNDLAFTPNWLDQLVLCLKTAGEKLHIREVGLVGPASNYVGGFQAVNNMRYTLSEVDSVAEKFHELNEGNWHYTHFLSGFCLLFTRKVFEEVGFLDERFNPGGFDDNDYCLRAFRKGFALIIAGDTFIHHFGSKTLDLPPFKHMKRGMANQEKFIRKWLDDKSQKVFAMYRIKNVERWIGQSLAKTSEFADGIVILDDGSKDGTPEIVKQFPKVVDYKYHNRSLQEARDRQELLEMTKSYNPDWIVAIDGDEVWEDKVNRDYIQRLARPFDPEINAYVVRYFTFWDDIKHYRADGIFGSMSNIRMFRNLPNQFMHSDHPQGFHVNSVPRFPWGCRAVTSIRVKHYGYVNEEDRLRKFLFYTKFDTDKRRTDIGNEDYHHLVSQTVRRRKWKEDCSL
ncbi:TPA: hypothetical protein DCX15_06565, partial [bacterium]|nr:hypothetical protein [bacterium]